MGLIKGTARPQSKKDRTLPYTYEGRVDILEGKGAEPVYDHYFSDTLCGLVECLDEEGFGPDRVRLFGLYRGEKSELDNSVLVDDRGRWLKRPALCRALEQHYAHAHEECYRGHVEKGPCSFEDRDRSGEGPAW
ncbi:MAG: hypothetical protein AB7V45_04765 [Candidatus Krumholzibacteriia bacterium]